MPLIVFIFIYSFAYKVDKMPKSFGRIIGFVVVIIMFLISLGFDIMVYGLNQALY